MTAAESRRRDDSGRFGFTMGDIRTFLQESIYKDNPDDCPSLATIRRVFEAPHKQRKSSKYYQAHISARPGVKRNDAPAGGEVHPHTYECLTDVRYTK